MNSIKISIIMPVYNTEKYVGEAIESILRQSFNDFEFIIIDDCSTDSSYNICKKYANKDSRIRLYRNQKNIGVVKTRNKLLDLVNKNVDFITIIDADDMAVKDRLLKQISFLEKNIDYSLVGSNIEIVNEKGKNIGYRRYPKDNEEVGKIICKKSPLAQPSVMIRKSDLEKVGNYNENFERVQDYELWFRFFDAGYKIGNIQEFLLRYRVFSEQGKSKHLKLTIKNTLKIQKKYIFARKYFSVTNFLYFLTENILLFLPNQFILFLFKKLEYKKIINTIY